MADATPVPRTNRGKAAVVAFTGGLMIVGLGFLIVWGSVTFLGGGQAANRGAMTNWPLAATIVGVLGVPVALLAMMAARVRDKRNFEIARALPLPARHLQDGDLVWLRGTLQVADPLTPPEGSGVTDPVAWYYFEHQQKSGDKWKTVSEETKHASAALRTSEDDTDHDVRVDVAAALLEFTPRKKHSTNSERFDLSYLPAGKHVSCCGRVRVHPDHSYELLPISDTRKAMVTPLDRVTWIQSSEAEEVVYGTGGLTVLGASLLAAVAGVMWYATSDLAMSLLVGLAVGAAAVLWTVVAGTLSRFGKHRARVELTWNDVKADSARQLELLTDLATTTDTIADDLNEDDRRVLQQAHDLIDKSAKDDAVTSGEAKPEDAAKSDRAAAALATRIAAAEDLMRATAALLKIEHDHLKEDDARDELSRIEAELAWGRTLFNEVASEYNDLVGGFPRGVAARVLGFKPVTLWKSE